MTTAVHALEARSAFERLIAVIRDILTIAERYLIAYWRVPSLLVFNTIQPIIFVLLFRYVFGGAVSIPGVSYVEYLMPGIFVQTVVFGATNTAIGLSTDVKSGLLERFRSLPMATPAVLTGRTIADFARNVVVVAVMVGIGFAVGFRVHTGVFSFFAGMLLVLFFAYALSWILAAVGIALGDPESAQAAIFPVIAPLVFASSAFIPVSTMPSWLRGFAAHQPVSVTASAVRALMIGGPLRWDLIQSLAWSAGLVLLFAPLAIWRYRRAV